MHIVMFVHGVSLHKFIMFLENCLQPNYKINMEGGFLFGGKIGEEIVLKLSLGRN